MFYVVYDVNQEQAREFNEKHPKKCRLRDNQPQQRNRARDSNNKDSIYGQHQNTDLCPQLCPLLGILFLPCRQHEIRPGTGDINSKRCHYSYYHKLELGSLHGFFPPVICLMKYSLEIKLFIARVLLRMLFASSNVVIASVLCEAISQCVIQVIPFRIHRLNKGQLFAT